jgi:hypothetical protein
MAMVVVSLLRESGLVVAGLEFVPVVPVLVAGIAE